MPRAIIKLNRDAASSLAAVPRLRVVWLGFALLTVGLIGRAPAEKKIPPPPVPRVLHLTLQTRDPATGQIRLETQAIDSRKIGVVAVDMWNFHWCKTSTQRVAALVPRMNRCLQAARGLGMQVFLCPTDVADNYAGFPQKEAVHAVPLIPVPALKQITCPPAPDGGGCTCGGPLRCGQCYGWDGMHPDLIIGEYDLMPNQTAELYALCRQRGITHLIYVGVHTQVCLLGKSVGLAAMSRAGLHCMLARDLTDAHGLYDPQQAITPDAFTANVVEHFEKHLSPTINMADEMRKTGQWDDAWIVDPVRFAPWGTPTRPHHYEQEFVLTMSTPLQPSATIYYTTDGSQPGRTSTRYTGPITLGQPPAAWRIRAVAFQDARPVCLESEMLATRLPVLPPQADVHLSDLEPLRAVGPGHSPEAKEHRFSARSNPPQKNLSNDKRPLVIRRTQYAKGMGVHAPCQLVYALKPEYRRFVALAGMDEGILKIENGSNLAMHSTAVFRVFVDGKLAAESPVMRITEPAWRFDVPLPPGSRIISLAVMDSGDGNREDVADWVEAGFVTDKAEPQVLIFSKTAWYRHPEIPALNGFLSALGAKHGFQVDVSETADDLTPERLAAYHVLVLNNTTDIGKSLNDQQQTAVREWFGKGHGIVGLHAALVHHDTWPWFTQLAGCDFNSDSDFLKARLLVDPANRHDPSVAGFGPEFFYSADWTNHDRAVTGLPGVRVLLRADETTFHPVRAYFQTRGGKAMGQDHPVSWKRDFAGGRFFFTALGHDVRSLDTPFGRQHVIEAWRWAAGKSPAGATGNIP